MATDDSENLEQTLGPELDEALLALDELAQDDPEEALSMFESLPEPVQALPDFQLVLARAHQGLGQLEAARDLAKAVALANDENGDAHHLLGDILEDLGDTGSANRHFLRTLALDKVAYADVPEDERLDSGEVQTLLADLLGQLLASRKLDLVMAVLPDDAQVESGIDPRTLLHVGAGRISVFLANVQAEFGDLVDSDVFDDALTVGVARQVVDALGLSESEITKLGLAGFLSLEDDEDDEDPLSRQ